MLQKARNYFLGKRLQLSRLTPMETSEGPSGSITTYFVVYVVILAISALQILIAYSNVEGSRIFFRMLGLAIVQAGLAITFFMHIKSEKRNLALFLLPATLFVLAMMNMIWSDSFLLLTMRSFALYAVGGEKGSIAEGI